MAISCCSFLLRPKSFQAQVLRSMLSALLFSLPLLFNSGDGVYPCSSRSCEKSPSFVWIDLLKAPDGWERARPNSLGLVFNASPIGGARHEAGFPAAPPPPLLFLRHAEIITFVLRTMCSFDSHHPLIDPITPKSPLFSKVFEMPIGGKGEGPAFLNPVNQSGHFSRCCHSPGWEVRKTVNESWRSDNNGIFETAFSAGNSPGALTHSE